MDIGDDFPDLLWGLDAGESRHGRPAPRDPAVEVPVIKAAVPQRRPPHTATLSIFAVAVVGAGHVEHLATGLDIDRVAQIDGGLRRGGWSLAGPHPGCQHQGEQCYHHRDRSSDPRVPTTHRSDRSVTLDFVW